MSLVARITALAQAVGADIKALSANMLDLAGTRRMTGPVRFAVAPELVLNNGQLDLAAATSNSVRGRIDGPIVDLGSLPAGEVRTVRFLGGGSTAKLVYSYASIRLPANADIPLSEGDTAEFYSLGNGTWELRFFQRQDGTALVGTAAPVSSVAGRTGVVTLGKGDVGLGNVDNTADSAKPVSIAQGTAIAAKATLAEALAQMQVYGPSSPQLPTISDLAVVPDTRIGRYTTNSGGTPVAGQSGVFLNAAYSTTTAAQLAMHIGQSSANPLLLYKVMVGGAWGGYKQVAFTDSPALTGTPTATSPTAGLATDQIQTTLGVRREMQVLGLGTDSAPNTLADADFVSTPGIGRTTSGTANRPSAISGSMLTMMFSAPGANAAAIQNAQIYIHSSQKLMYRFNNQAVGSWSTAASESWVQSFGLGQIRSGEAGSGSVVPTPAALGNTSPTMFITVGGDTVTTDTATNHNPVSGETFAGLHVSSALRPKQFGVSGFGSGSTFWWRGYQGASPSFAEWRRATVHGAPTLLGQFTLATLPSASAYSGHLIDVTNATGGVKTCRSNGTNWIILNTTTIVS